MKKALKWTAIILVLLLAGSILFVYTQLPKPIGSTPELQSELFDEPDELLPMEGKYIYRSASELASLIRKGEATSMDIVTEHIAHIKNNNWKYNSLIWLREEEAMKDAAKADAAIKRGDTLLPLLGVPVTIKEQFWVKGSPSTLNTKRIGLVAEKDAVIVRQIKEAGAVILGTTNVPFMLTDYQTYGEIYPTANNPYDTTRTPGGSTGGGASALAAGFTSLSLGSDLGGSVRVPAAFCGLYGLKPGFGVLNVTQGVMPNELYPGGFFAMASAGPLTRTAEDLELFWNVLVNAPKDPDWQPTINWKAPSGRSLNQYSIAWLDEWKRKDGKIVVGEDVKVKLKILLDSLMTKGVLINRDEPDTFDEMIQVWMSIFPQIIAQGESWLVRKLIKTDFSSLDDGSGNFEPFYENIDNISEESWNQAKNNQKILIQKVESFFAEYDFLILPLTYGPAIKKCEKCPVITTDDGTEMPYIGYFPYSAIFNATEHPVVVIPMGLNDDGLPIGIQIVGPHKSEPELLYFTRLISPMLPGFSRPGM